MCWCGKRGDWYCRQCGEMTCDEHSCSCFRCQCPCHNGDLAAHQCTAMAD